MEINEKQYELLTKKAELFDGLVEALFKIKRIINEDINEISGQMDIFEVLNEDIQGK